MRSHSILFRLILAATIAPALFAARPDPELVKALNDEQEFTASLKSGKHDRWSTLPDWIKRVYISPTGDAWFEADHLPGMDSDKSLIESVEHAAAGQTRVIRGGIARIDRAGRFFVMGARQRLHCYDPATKKWSVRHADGTEPPTDRKAPEPGADTSFQQENWEDSSGADWFLGGSMRLGWFVQRQARDGAWSAWPFLPDLHASDFPLRAPIFVEQPAGGFTICATLDLDNTEHNKVVAVRFDGKSFLVLNPRVCDKHDLKDIIPNRDGSITTLCSEQAFWTFWPPAALEAAAKEAGKLIGNLSDPDSNVRESAQQRLALMGHRASDAMQKALGSAPPGTQARLRDLIALDKNLGADAHQTTHNDKIPYAGEWTHRTAYVISRNYLGHTALFLEDVQNVYTKKKSDLAIAIMQNDGTWDVRLADRKQWESTGWQSVPQNAFVDSRGRIWADHGTRRIEPDMTMHVLPPSGLELNTIIGEDRDGRIYFVGSNGKYDVLDEGRAQAVAQIETKSFPGFGPYAVADETTATAINTDRTSLLALRDGDAKQIDTGFADEAILNIVPLHNGAAILGGGDELSDKQWMFWDGTRAVSAPDLQPLVEQNAAAIVRLADRDFSDHGNIQLASDDHGGLWFAHRYYQISKPPAAPKQKQVYQFRFFDGASWHDVIADLKAPSAGMACLPLHAVNSGRFVLVRNATKLVSVGYSQGKLVTNDLMSDLRGASPPDHFVDSRTGDTWGCTQGKLLLIHDGQFQPQDQSAVPLCVDLDNRLWCAQENQLMVKTGDSWIESKISGVDANTKIVQTADKRIWALHREALSLVSVADGAIKESGRWSWGSPRSEFVGLVADGSKYLWFAGNEKSVIRLTLPG